MRTTGCTGSWAGGGRSSPTRAASRCSASAPAQDRRGRRAVRLAAQRRPAAPHARGVDPHPARARLRTSRWCSTSARRSPRRRTMPRASMRLSACAGPSARSATGSASRSANRSAGRTRRTRCSASCRAASTSACARSRSRGSSTSGSTATRSAGSRSASRRKRCWACSGTPRRCSPPRGRAT